VRNPYDSEGSLLYSLTMPTYAFAEWLADQIRLTVFPSPGATDYSAQQWWEAIVGGPPEQVTTNLRMGQSTMVGAFHAGKLILKLEPGRIDWLFTPPDPDPIGPTGNLPSIGPISENLASFSDLAERWLGLTDIPDLTRIAFGMVVSHPEEDRRSAYMRLPDYLPIRVDPDSSDFIFQINVPTVSRTKISGLRINRLTRWSIMALTQVALRLEGTRVATASSGIMAHALRAEMDINTSPEFPGVLPRNQLVEVYQELVALGQGVVTEGLPQ
jgi:hypothetical protein